MRLEFSVFTAEGEGNGGGGGLGGVGGGVSKAAAGGASPLMRRQSSGRIDTTLLPGASLIRDNSIKSTAASSPNNSTGASPNTSMRIGKDVVTDERKKSSAVKRERLKSSVGVNDEKRKGSTVGINGTEDRRRSGVGGVGGLGIAGVVGGVGGVATDKSRRNSVVLVEGPSRKNSIAAAPPPRRYAPRNGLHAKTDGIVEDLHKFLSSDLVASASKAARLLSFLEETLSLVWIKARYEDTRVRG